MSMRYHSNVIKYFCWVLLILGGNTLLFAQESGGNYHWVTGISTTLGRTQNFTPYLTDFTKVYQPILLSEGDVNNTANSFFGAAYLGRKLNERWIVGLSIDYRHVKIAYEDFFILGGQDTLDFIQRHSEYSASIFGRYILNKETRLQLIVQPALSIGYTRGAAFTDATEVSNYVSYPGRLQLKAGAQYQLARHWYLWCLPLGLDYTFGKERLPGKNDKRSYADLNIDFSLSRIILGLEYRF
jgi:hypothetical protein